MIAYIYIYILVALGDKSEARLASRLCLEHGTTSFERNKNLFARTSSEHIVTISLYSCALSKQLLTARLSQDETTLTENLG